MGILHPTGEDRFWTLKEFVQGKPLKHPSHTMFVHFPIAFFMGALFLDVASLFLDIPPAPLMATWLIFGGLAGAALAVITGLVDWFDMVKGSSKRRWATVHMLLQLASIALFDANLFIRLGDRGQPAAEISWIVLGALGVGIQLVGNWYGGVLVFEKGMRVSTGGEPK
jgi:uncharacterized membrane protein